MLTDGCGATVSVQASLVSAKNHKSAGLEHFYSKRADFQDIHESYQGPLYFVDDLHCCCQLKENKKGESMGGVTKHAMVVIVFLLAGCSKGVPVTFTKSQHQFIGTWRLFHVTKTKSSLEYKNVLLAIHPDSHAEYMKCIISENWEGERNSSTSKSNRRNYTSLPGAVITEMTDEKITLEMKVWVFHLHYHLTINKPPHLENGHWYLSVENTLLQKLDDKENAKANWTCPETDDET